MEKNYIIYKHTSPSGKIYIGQTKQGLNKRSQNGKGYLHKNKKGEYAQPAFANAILKYGWENFEHEILMEGLTLEEANYYEEKLIKEYDSTNPNKGYNIGQGGNNSNYPEESKKKISEARKNKYCGEKNPMYDKHHSEETRKKISEAKKGVFTEKQRERHWSVTGNYKHPIGVYHHSDETKEKIKKSRNVNKDKYNKQVRQIDVDTNEIINVFESSSYVSRQLNIDRSSINKVCRGERLSAGGFKWEYCEKQKRC